MKSKKIKWVTSLLVVFTFAISSCSSHKKIEQNDEYSVDSANGNSNSTSTDDLTLDEGFSASEKGGESNSDASLEKELNALDSSKTNSDASSEQLTLDNEPSAPVAVEPVPATPAPVVEEPPAPVAVEPVVEAPAPIEAMPAPVTEEPPVAIALPKAAIIENVEYFANDGGGTLSILGNQPLSYKTRFNEATNQLVVEVENSEIPKKLKRTLNTKDMDSTIGSVDIYQKPGSSVSRFVIQMRAGASEPVVQQEGNALLVVGGTAVAKAEPFTNEPNEVVDLSSKGIMGSDTLEDFLIDNNKFYGKKISIETNGIEVKDALKFLAEESGVNMIIDDTINEKVSLKLQNVPWDQALVLILKNNRLAYVRQGNVLRIAKASDVAKDAEDALKMMESRKTQEPLIVRRFFIGYADITELGNKITEFLKALQAGADSNRTSTTINSSTQNSSNGKVITDKRTSSLIVTDTESNIAKIEKLIKALDTQPPQVLIEGRVVEATENFSRGLGIDWTTPGNTGATNTSNIGIATIGANGESGVPAIFNSNITWGALDLFGSLTARLQLGQTENKAKILSSPRITVLSNEKATINQTLTVQIPSTSTTDPTTGATTQTFTTVTAGVTLNVTPQISNEGTILMDLDVTKSFPVGTQINSRNAKTKTIVKSGQTAVVGGIFDSTVTDIARSVPFLSDVPIFGRLFRADSTLKIKNELMIFVTPNILKAVVGTAPVPGSDIE